MTRIVSVTIFILTIVSCNNDSEQDLKVFFENIPWVVGFLLRRKRDYFMIPKGNPGQA